MRSWMNIVAGVLAAAVATAAAAGDAGTYPVKGIQLVVPYTPGGNTDLLGRLIGQKLEAAWRVPVVVDNRPGAGGTIGVNHVAKSRPDGYTLVLGAFGNILVAPALYRNLPYDPARDLVPVVLLATPPTIVTSTRTLAFDDIAGLVTYAKAHPGKLNFGSSGHGTSNHLLGELFASMAQVRMTHVAYKGSGPAINDLIAGITQVNFAPYPLVGQQVKAGTLKALAVTSAQRSPLLPEVPTVAEAGLPGYEGTGWFALMAPKGTPAEVVGKLNREVNRILKTPEVRTALSAEGAVPIGGSPADAARSMAEGMAKWQRLVKALDIRIE